MNATYRTVAFIAISLLAHIARADTYREYWLGGSTDAPDLRFPTEVSDIEFATEPVMALYKPGGAGPFPALVLMHQCGGMNNNLSMLEWSKKAVSRGYVVLQIDALTQRGARSLCQGPQNKIFPSRGVRDALLAAAYLRSLPYVDKNRVAYAGFSWGGGIGLMAASKMSVDKLGISERFNAVASNYPPCVYFPKNGDPYSGVLKDIDTPLMVLVGGKDNETPPELCTEQLEPKIKAGEPVTVHTYRDGYHCWDCKQWDGKRKTDIRGHTVDYMYDEVITKDSEDRMFQFFENSFQNAK